MLFAGLALMIGACSVASEPSETQTPVGLVDHELIVLAAPHAADGYYTGVEDKIFDFHVAYARAILAAGDDVIVLAPKARATDYREALGADHVVASGQQDIWMRDFGLANPGTPLMFHYTAAGQGGGREGQAEADYVQESFAGLADRAGLSFAESDLFNDGGNWVDDYAGNVVVSRKFLIDNEMTEAQARVALRAETGAVHIAFIDADEQGGLEHADGVVAFVDANVLVINSYDEDPDYQAALIADLKAGLPGVEIHKITTPYDGSEIYDERFGSACGLYTNMLVTPQRIYLPQFGIPEDALALQQVRGVTTKTVIPVSSQQVCQMGGGVRCMSMQLRGENAALLRAYIDR